MPLDRILGTCRDSVGRGAVQDAVRVRPGHLPVIWAKTHRFRPKHHEIRRALPRKLALNRLDSWSHTENSLTPALSSTHWEVPICRCVFNKLLGGSFIFNIFFCAALCFHQLIGRFPFRPFLGTTSRLRKNTPVLSS